MSTILALIIVLLRDVLSSKKAMAAITGILLIISKSLGLPITEEMLYQILTMIGTYIVGQGVADIGKPAEQAKVSAAYRNRGYSN